MSFRIRIIRCSLPLVAWGEKSSFRIKIASYLKANPAWKLDIIKFLIQVVSSSSILTYSRSLLFCIIRPSLSYYYSTVAQDKQWLSKVRDIQCIRFFFVIWHFHIVRSPHVHYYPIIAQDKQDSITVLDMRFICFFLSYRDHGFHLACHSGVVGY
jgi:hypothetical protein